MASLVERLRVRTERRPLYDDDSDDDFVLHKRGVGAPASSSSVVPEDVERVVREDAVCTLTEIEKILDRELCTTKLEDEGDESKQSPRKSVSRKYLVKWKGLSYLHCSWCS